jgi:hypothetical protein
MPIVVVCPKFADSFNETAIRANMIANNVPANVLDSRTDFENLLTFTIAGAGFNNVREEVGSGDWR